MPNDTWPKQPLWVYLIFLHRYRWYRSVLLSLIFWRVRFIPFSGHLHLKQDNLIKYSYFVKCYSEQFASKWNYNEKNTWNAISNNTRHCYFFKSFLGMEVGERVQLVPENIGVYKSQEKHDDDENCFNPLSPSIHIQILQTGFHTFPKELVERIW